MNLIEAVKTETRGFEGAIHHMLRNQATWFIRLGQAIERADNTARLLDVKYHILLPEGETVGGVVDRDQWTTILQTVSAVTAYRWLYSDGLQAGERHRPADRDATNCRAASPPSAEKASRLRSQLAKRTGHHGEADRMARGAPARGSPRRGRPTSSSAGCTNISSSSSKKMRSAFRDRAAVQVRLMRIAIAYQTSYAYAEPARAILQLLRVQPRPHEGQQVIRWRIDADADVRLRWTKDAFGNIVHALQTERPTQTLSVSVRGEIQTQDKAGDRARRGRAPAARSL